MKRCFVAVLTVLLFVPMGFAQEAQNGHGRPEPPMLGIHWAKGIARPRSNPDMLWHNGAIMTDAAVKVIYWGPKWANSSFVGDKISGLDSWYTGFSNSNYAKTSDEYTGTNGQVTATTSNGGYFIDTTTASGGGSTSAILAEVCRAIPSTVADGYYPVYTDLPRGNAGYCAWHSYGSCGGTPVQFAFFWSLDGDPGCDPQDTTTGHSQGLAALANVSAHELSGSAHRSPQWRLVRSLGGRKRRQVRLDFQCFLRHIFQRHQVEAARRVVECGV